MKERTLADLILDEHHAVLSGIQAVRGELAASTKEGLLYPTAVIERLREFEGHLRQHFELEETAGPLSDSFTRTPGQEERAQELLRQHPEFLARLARLFEALGPGSSLPPHITTQITDELNQLFLDLRAHESMENVLFQEQVYEETGAGD